ncbi:hypothetical protein MBLNU459_g1587t2 [Dothideomycetes sp. NU459]
MGSHSDGLLNELLFRVALTGAQEELEADDGDETDILFSLRPPASKSKNDSHSPDPKQLEDAWQWLVQHPDVFVVQADEEKRNEPPGTNQVSQLSGPPISPTTLGTLFSTYSHKRLRATEDRIWYALTDHGVDHRRIPKMEFLCLQVIAAAGPQGVLQPEVIKATGQDKRSVPKRTDALEKKGLITKESCVAMSIKTSLLRLKKFSTHGSEEMGAPVTNPAVDSDRRMIRYDEWWNSVIGILKRHNNFMAYEDLRSEMGITGKRWETRALFRCMRRLNQAGCITRVKARVTPTEEEEQALGDDDTELDNDAQDDGTSIAVDADDKTKTKRKKKKQVSRIRWVRCVKLMREPTEKDRHAFTSTAHLPKEESVDDQNDSDVDEEDQAELEGDDSMLQPIAGLGRTKEMEVVERIPAQWHPYLHQTQFLFYLINSCGTTGISTMDLVDRAMGHFWRRPLDELIGRLTDVWRVSQPAHLRHLSLVRDTAYYHRVSHYQFRSFDNYRALVTAGEALWEAIDVDPEIFGSEGGDLDSWGFPTISPNDMYGVEGTANMVHLKSTTADSTLRRGMLKPTPKKKAPKLLLKPGRAANKARETSQSRVQNANNEIPHGTLGTVARVSEASAPTAKATTTRAKWQIPQKRVDAEMKAWKHRARKLAEYRAGVEMGLVNKVVSSTEKSQHTLALKAAAKEGDPQIQSLDAAGSSDQLTHEAASPESNSITAIISNPQTTKDIAVDGTSTLKGQDLILEKANDSRALPEDRLSEIEAEILTLSTPGAYIDPPGAAQLKMLKVLARGRPRKHIIAVVKTEKLREKEWFIPDPICHESMPRMMIHVDGRLVPAHSNREEVDRSVSKAPDEIIEEPLETASPPKEAGEQEPQRSTAVSDQPPATTRGIKRKAIGILRESEAKRLATESVQEEATEPVTTQEHIGEIDVDAGCRRLISAGLDIPDTTSLLAGESAAAPSVTDTSSNTEINTVDANATANGTDNGGRVTSATHDDESPHTGKALANTDVEMGDHDASNFAGEVLTEHRATGGSTTFQQECADRPILSVEEVTEQKTTREAPVSGRKAAFKVGVGRSAGIVGYNRRETLLRIIRKHGGIFGGERELYYPFITIWEREHKHRPDRHTLDRTLKTLLADDKLRKIAFTFEVPDGRIVTKHIVMEPDIDPESEAVKDLQQRIIDFYPLTYVPEDADVAPDLRDQMESHVLNLRRQRIQISMRSHFPQDENAFVTRHYPTSVRPSEVRLGMTEAMLERDVAVRKRKREQEERRQERYMRAQQEEEIAEAQAALQTDFQLESYRHEPKRAKVDRGPRGRGRLSKLQRWHADEPTARGKALGLLAAGKTDTVPQVPSVARMHKLPSRYPPQHGAFHRFPATISGLGYGAGVIETFTLTSPYQRWYPLSGTFSTDPRVFSVPSRATGSTDHLVDSAARDQLSIPMADIIIEAASAPLESASGFGILEPQPLSHDPPGVPSSTGPQRSAIPRATTLELAPWKAPSVTTSSAKIPSSKANIPRATRNGIFVMSEAEEQRLVIAVIVVRSLVGGLEQHPNWGIIHQIFHYKFSASYCRQRFSQLRGKLAATADKLQFEFQKIFVEAYDREEVPQIDFLDFESYDWIAVVDWAEARLDASKIPAPERDLPDLPANRSTLDERFHVKVPEDIYGVAREDFWAAHITQVRREELTASWTHCKPLSVPTEVSPDEDHLLLAKSWVRSNVLTPDHQFDDNLAHNKLSKLSDDSLPRALEGLLGAKIIRMDNKGRAAPGRNYDVNDALLRAFRRPWDVDHLRHAAAFKATLDAEFLAHGKIALSYQTPDPEMMALTNLVAAGRVKVVPVLPPINHDLKAPWPRLSKWGFTEGNYKTVHMNKERLHFGIELHPTPAYVHGVPLDPAGRRAPPLTKQFPGEVGARLPLWTDINGALIEELWNMMLTATLHLLVFRPGLTVDVMVRNFDGKLWAWELDLFLEWAENVGIAKKVEEGLGEGGEAGWRAAEWWWLTFAA